VRKQMFFNESIQKLKPYVVTSHKAWEQCELKKRTLKLDWNESTIPPSPRVSSAILNFVESGMMNWYPNVDNIKLRSLLAKYVGLPAANIEYFSSSDSLHEYILRAFVCSGDVVLQLTPSYDNFRAVAESFGANIQYLNLDKSKNYDFCYDTLSTEIEVCRPKIVYLCNPNNPTGTIISKKDVENLVKRFNDVLFILDEAYYEFTGITSKELALDFQNIVICRTFSKAFGLASLRFGYVIASENNVEGLKKIRNPKSVNTVAQVAAVAALEDITYMINYVEQVNTAKRYLVDELSKRNYTIFNSTGGNYILLDLGLNAMDFVKALEENNIYVRSYRHVAGMDTLVRITVGNHEQMSYLVSLIDDVYPKGFR